MNKNKDNDNSAMENTYWRSFAEFFNDTATKEQMKPEFIPGAAEDLHLSEMNGLTRRHFLGLLGASAALAGVACSDYKDQGEIVPYNKKPIDGVPGIASYFASTMVDQGEAYGVLVKTREGRPIKVDGNPDHPVSKGKINSRIQATIMGLYDPERLKEPTFKRSKVDWVKADLELGTAISSAIASKKTIAVITHSVLSPSLNEILTLLEEKGFKVYSYELTGSQLRDQVWAKSFGSGRYPLIDWSQPKIILALESDFLGAEAGASEAITGFASNRSGIIDKKDRVNKFNKLYAVEGQLSVTGMNADTRVRLSPSLQVDFILNLILKLKDSFTFDASILELAGKATKVEIPENLVRDILANRGNTFVYAGEKLSKDSHYLVNYLNEVLGTKAYRLDSQRQSLRPLQVSMDIQSLAAEMEAGNVGAVIHLDCNPVFHFPKDSNYVKALEKVAFSVAISDVENETTVASHLVIPAHHALESWGDYSTRSGLYSLQQPLMNPLYKTRQKEGVLLSVLTGGAYQETAYREFIKAYATKEVFSKLNSIASFEVIWKTALQSGFVKFNSPAVEAKKISLEAVGEIQTGKVSKDMTVLLASSPLGDGRHIGNGWLQEIPHPVSKVVWDNYAAVSIDTAKKLDIRTYVTPYDKRYDTITVEVEGRRITLPVMMQPGMADDFVMIELGYGRKNAGVIGSGESNDKIGVNAIELMSAKGGLSPWLFADAKVSKASEKYELVSTQEYHSLEGEVSGEGPVGSLLHFAGSDEFLAKEVSEVVEKRAVVKEGTVENGLHMHKHEVFSINDLHEYPGYKWAMAIDMNKCTGCNDCIVSCNVENNIPVVGKNQVNKGREMHWMRIDRYFKGSTTNVKAVFQPMLCQHCDNAPCENVCPVVATAHSPEGLNDMAYNRCVGTRYCANNCPYKVRRFNFYNFRNSVGRPKNNEWAGKGFYENKSIELMHNPEVTVRSRGVMEKCSFCVQRIYEAKQKAKEQGRVVRDGDVVTACQSACPANAIIFGNINDAHSQIRKWANSDLNYKVLEEINVRPNVNYLAKLRYEDSVVKTDHKETPSGGHH